MNSAQQRGKYILADWVAAIVTWLLFNWLRYEELAVYEGFSSLRNYLMYHQVWKGQLLVPIFWLLLFALSGYYNKPFAKSRLTEFFSTLITVTIGVVFLFFAIILNDLPRKYEVYYELFFILWGIQFLSTYIPRLLITLDGIRRIKRREWSARVLIMGVGRQAGRLADDLYKLGYTIVGFVEIEEEGEPAVASDLIVGRFAEMAEMMPRLAVDELVLAPDSADMHRQLSILHALYSYGVPIKVLADNSNMLSRVNIKTIHGEPLVDLTDNNFSEAEKNIKWLFDKVIAVVALVVLSPAFLYVAWRIRRESEGPVFFRQERVGRFGKPFLICKFRTMYLNAEEQGPLLSVENDSRITPFGRIMRKYRIDELPQFWNVLKGEMSLVGPRPERPYYIHQIVKEAPYYYLLHNVRPGITSLGMVKYGYATNVEQMIERLKYDILYYENMSLVLDITILIYTVKTVVTGKGV
ncbi:sugar transferase [Parabacteroides sp. OttesenSCG-928-N08]|nr:sugar transferase [Parabacteroides sp. OttesenSCG-928-N08]